MHKPVSAASSKHAEIASVKVASVRATAGGGEGTGGGDGGEGGGEGGEGGDGGGGGGGIHESWIEHDDGGPELESAQEYFDLNAVAS